MEHVNELTQQQLAVVAAGAACCAGGMLSTNSVLACIPLVLGVVCSVGAFLKSKNR